ncbi:MAG: ClpXP protease specificity-enhancing factor [Gammaproteobacteria bacterium]
MNAEAEPPPLSRRPYFLRAMHEWMSDAGLTPQIIVNTRAEGVRVPAGYGDEAGRVVFNIGAEAVRDLVLDNAAVSFNARFDGVAHSIYLPTPAILGVYARETGEGIAFGEEEKDANERPAESQDPDAKQAERPTLKIVK